MTILVSPPHSPTRPGWWCRACGQPYPCPQGRRWLAATHQHTGQLGRVAYQILEEAVPQLPGVPVAQLWDRFVAWTEPAGGR